MKPKNSIFCPDCGRQKLLFQTEKEAMTFIKFNGNTVNQNGTMKTRVYYCQACCGYHISSNEYKGDGQTQQLLDAYHKSQKRSGEVVAEPYAKVICDEMRDLGIKTRRQVVAYTNTKTTYAGSVISLARAMYYKELGIGKKNNPDTSDGNE